MNSDANTPPDASTGTPAGAAAGTSATPAAVPATPDVPAAPTATGPFVVPDDVSSLDQSTWQAADYSPVVFGSGAIKLHMSEVAPLVAVAHGNRSVNTASVKEAAKDYPLDVSGARHLARSVGSGDAMLMPWYQLEDVYQAGNQRSRTGADVEAIVASMQWRPSIPTPNADGKLAKYVVAKGHPTPMGVHPSTPTTWFDGPWPVMICEGSIKGDAALTGLLLDAGVPAADLALSTAEQNMLPTAAVIAARARLRDIMASIPAERRVLVLTLIGVGNWHQAPEWNAIKLTGGRTVMVAFDGDVATNPNVHRQAVALHRQIEAKHGTFALVQIPSVPGASKPGIDDYLATSAGSWSMLLATTTPNLPAPPAATSEFRVGDWRVNDATSVCEEYCSVTDTYGNAQNEWVPRIELAGRIRSIMKARAVTENEMATGRFDAEADANADGQVGIEVSWIDEGGKQLHALIEGGSDILADPPEMWHRRNGTSLPATISSLPAWPADKKWLQAIKGHRREDIDMSSVWNSMGWVPVAGSIPVYIAGNDVVGADGACSDEALPGIGDKEISGAGRFGLNPPGVEDFDETVRADIEAVIAAYTGGAWRNSGVAAIALAAAMRPCVPISPHCVILLTGARRSGKSWTAEAIMGFWQKKPGNFAGSLPGTAGDTKYSIENALSKTHIWVADDVAPSVDARKADATEGKIGSLIRDVHNRSATRRMGPDGKAREQLMPRALFIVTAENAQAASSEMDRVIHVTAGENFLGSRDATDAVRDLNKTTSTANRVATAAIMMIARMARENGWSQTREDWNDEVADQNRAAAGRMGGGEKVARHAGMAADLALGLSALSQLAEQVGCSDETLDAISQMFNELFDYVRIGYEDQTSTSPGHAIVRALRSLLASGGAHIGVAGQGGPPITNQGSARYSSHATEISQSLGWQFSADSKDVPRAGGPQIGFIAKNAKSDDYSIVFDPQAAFKVAQQAYPNLILHGSKPTSTWNSAWAEGLCTPEDVGWKRKPTNGSAVREIVRTKGGEGVPIPLSTLVIMPGDDT